MQDAYFLLGIDPAAPIEEIEAAYIQKNSALDPLRFVEGTPEHDEARQTAEELAQAFRAAVSASFSPQPEAEPYTEMVLEEVLAPSLLPAEGRESPPSAPRRSSFKKGLLLVPLPVFALYALYGLYGFFTGQRGAIFSLDAVTLVAGVSYLFCAFSLLFRHLVFRRPVEDLFSHVVAFVGCSFLTDLSLYGLRGLLVAASGNFSVGTVIPLDAVSSIFASSIVRLGPLVPFALLFFMLKILRQGVAPETPRAPAWLRFPTYGLTAGVTLIALSLCSLFLNPVVLNDFRPFQNIAEERHDAEAEQPLPQTPLTASKGVAVLAPAVVISQDTVLLQTAVPLQAAALPVKVEPVQKASSSGGRLPAKPFPLPDEKGFRGHAWGLSVQDLKKSLPNLYRLNKKSELYSADEALSVFGARVESVVVYEFYKNRLYKITLMGTSGNPKYPIEAITKEISAAYGVEASAAPSKQPAPAGKQTFLWRTEAVTAALTFIPATASSKSSFYADFYHAPLLQEKLEQR